MLAVVLTVVALWLLLSVLASAACALVARGGRDEDLLRNHLLAADDQPAVPRPRVTAG